MLYFPVVSQQPDEDWKATGLLRFLPLFHKQNENQIKRLNVCREITFREQTQNGGGFGKHELDQPKGSPPPYIKPHFRM